MSSRYRRGYPDWEKAHRIPNQLPGAIGRNRGYLVYLIYPDVAYQDRSFKLQQKATWFIRMKLVLLKQGPEQKKWTWRSSRSRCTSVLTCPSSYYVLPR